ncbi:MAG: HEAT repeat domain-containing protein [Candidatus Helarchaeota archaeon]
MGKIEKKILKMVDKEKIDKAVKFAFETIKFKGNEEKAEAIVSLGALFRKNKEKNLPFPDELYELLIKNLDSNEWIIRRSILQIIGEIAELYIDKVVEKESLNKIKLRATKDGHWAVRVDGLKALGKMGLNFPEDNQIVTFLVNQGNDKDPEVRIAALESLTMILKKFPEKIKPNLHIYVEHFKSDDDYRVSLVAETAIKEFAELMKEK